jgi:hypothetical protein
MVKVYALTPNKPDGESFPAFARFQYRRTRLED